MRDEIVEINSNKDGPVSVILAGVHGNEKSGVKALEKLLPNLQIERGRLFTGFGNPQAIKVNKRYVDYDLNRLFVSDDSLPQETKSTYEYERSKYLKTFLNKADVLLDVHASTIPESIPFVICEQNAIGIAKYLPVDVVVSGFDKVEPGGTDYYMNKLGKIGICLESGHVNDSQSIKIAEESILTFLVATGHKDGKLIQRKQKYIKMFKKYFSKTANFVLLRPFNNFEKVQKGQLIGIDGEQEIRAPKDSVILFAHNSQKVGDEIFLLGEEMSN